MPQGDPLTVREVLEAAREAALEIRKLEEQAELRREAIGVQGHNSFEVHAKSGILDPSRRIDELLDWQNEQVGIAELQDPISEAYVIVAGIERISDSLTVEVTTRYYLQAESWSSIARDLADVRRVDALLDLSRLEQVRLLSKALDISMQQWEQIGIAHLREMGRL